MQAGKCDPLWRLPLLLLLALCSRDGVLPGQQVGDVPIPRTAYVDNSWPAVNLNVVVLNKQGSPQKVDERDFQLLENGTERPLQLRGSPGSPVSLALMIDTSGSIFKRKDAIIAAAKSIVKGMPDGSEVMAVTFTGVAYLDLPLTDVSKVDFSFLDRLQASGPTALYDAVFSTEDHLVANAKYARRALVILSDGEDNASHDPKGLVFWKMEQNGAPVVYACVPSKANVLQRDQMIGHINMKFLARAGGGPEFNLDPDPESAASQIVEAIRNQYAFQFTATDPARNGSARKLKMRVPVKEMQIHSLPEYFAPAK